MLTSETPQAEITDDVTRVDPEDGSEQSGLRILRAGGDVCPADESRLLSFTIDVWCDSDVTRNPKNIKSFPTPVGDEEDPCVTYISLEHAAGCPVLDYTPILHVLGAVMIFCGVTLQYFGRKAQKYFLRFIVTISTFLLCMGVCFKLNWLALLDPTEPEKNKSAFMLLLALLLSIVATIIVSYVFRKTLRFAPTFIGFVSGFWFSIYVIAAINGIGGIFMDQLPSQAGAGKDFIGPVWGGVIELCMSVFGALAGYSYSMIFILLIQTFVSSYLIVRGSTLIINLGFPNEIVLMESVSNETNGLVKLPTSFYIYSMTIIGLWGGTFYHRIQQEWDSCASEYHTDSD